MSQEHGDEHHDEHHEDHDQHDVVLTADDVEQVIDDDGLDPEPQFEEGDAAPRDGAEPLIQPDAEPSGPPANCIGATMLHDQKPVFALALHPKFPNPPLAVTGGGDDSSYIFCPIHPASGGDFTRDTFAPIKLSGHTDSVVVAAFSSDGNMVATGGMDGRVRVWRRVAITRIQALQGVTPPDDKSPAAWRTWEFVTTLEAGGEIGWLAWHPKGPVLAAGGEDGGVWLWQLPSGRTMTVLTSHTLSSSGGVFPAGGRQLLTASLDSSLILWNPAASNYDFKTSIFYPPYAPVLDPSKHGITSLAMSPSGAVAAVGGAGGAVRLVSLARGEIVSTLEPHKRGESVEALLFIDLLAERDREREPERSEKGIIVISGGTDGICNISDASSGRQRMVLPHPAAVTCMAAHPAPSQHLLTTGCADNVLRTWDVRSGALLKEHYGHVGPVLGVGVAPAPTGWESPLNLPNAQVVISAGDEGASLIWVV